MCVFEAVKEAQMYTKFIPNQKPSSRFSPLISFLSKSILNQ